MKSTRVFSVLWLSLFGILIFFGGCSSHETSEESFTLSGKAIDGYIKNATVCLDINNNTQCDADEPVTTTDENGDFKLQSVNRLVGSYAIVIVGGIDTATNEPFVGTLCNIVNIEPNSSSISTNITPLTTLAVLTAKSKNIPIEEAKESVAQSFGLQSDDIDADPMKNTEVFEQTQMVVKTTKTILKTISSDDIDVNATFDVIMEKIADDIADNNISDELNITSIVTNVSEVLSIDITQQQLENITTEIQEMEKTSKDENSTQNIEEQQSETNTTLITNTTTHPAPLNHPPVFTSPADFNVTEMQTTIAILTASDADGDSITYTLSGEDASLFDINATTGELKFLTPQDFETASKHTFNITVTASDAKESSSQNIVVTLLNLYEAPSIKLDTNESVVFVEPSESMVVTAMSTDEINTTNLEPTESVGIVKDITITTDENKTLQNALICLENAKHGDDINMSIPAGATLVKNITDESICLEVTGAASALEYSNSLKTIVFTNTDDNLSVEQRVVDITVGDGVEDSTVLQVFVDIVATDDDPEIKNNVFDVRFNLPGFDNNNTVAFSLLDCIDDPDSKVVKSTLVHSYVSQNSNISCDENLNCIYRPNDGYYSKYVEDRYKLDQHFFTLKDEYNREFTVKLSFYVYTAGGLVIVMEDTNSTSYTIPIDDNYEYAYYIDCGRKKDFNNTNYVPDLNTSDLITDSYTCEYEDTLSSEKQITIYGKFPHLYFINNCSQLKRIVSWGEIKYETFEDSFNGCGNANVIESIFPETGPDLSNVTSLHSMFENATITEVNMDSWDFSHIENMDHMFKNSTIGQLGDINSWDVSHVTEMIMMFYGTDFNQSIKDWNTSSVKKMSFMFKDASSFNQDISGWDVSNVEEMDAMFYGASSFNQDISGWDVSKVKYMDNMFKNATSFANHDLSSWDVSNGPSHGGFFDGIDGEDGDPDNNNTEPNWPN